MREDHASTAPGGAAFLSCNLAALDETQRKRRALLDEWLQVGTVDIAELSDGYAFHLDPVSLAARHVEEFVALERLCCPFLRFESQRYREESGPVLEIRGPAGVKEFLVSYYGIRGEGGGAG
jgi:hypothetical protein